MSKTTSETKEIFAIYKQNVDKYFSEVERSLPQYLQSITNLQQEYVAAWKNVIEPSISLQREFANSGAYSDSRHWRAYFAGVF